MMRAPLAISLRLGLLFAAIAVAVFVAVGAYLYQTLAMQMGQRDEVELLSKAALIRQMLPAMALEDARAGGGGQVQTVLARMIGQDGLLLHIARADGRVLLHTGPASVRPPALAPVPLARPLGLGDVAQVEDADGARRVLSMAATSGADVLHVTLTRMRSDRLAILKRYAVDLAGAILAGVLLATALGFVAVRRGLRPLRGVTARVNDISAHRLGTRLALDEVPAELRELCGAFNGMLDRLEDGVGRLSRFAADLAHDLRTPVNSLMMQTQVALSRARSVEEYQALLASIQEDYERLSTMIENTLFLARADNAQLALRCEALDAGQELARLGEYFGILAEDKGVTLSLESSGPLALRADPVLLRRALNNLLSNAVAYTPEGGWIRVAAEADGDGVALSVANSGEGIAAEHLEHVFDRYYRADPARAASSSAGLGLAIVRAIMRLHGGTAEVRSRPGEETVVVLRFPKQGGS
ncbi:two-component sensor histidine kinase [Massilia sp. KIM]|uniref:heavy metal sensor histidine kinase n=1 Tax=Massilia sp. KIM TaxID=1955422 RepID=UPI00098EF53F|nr:heavy metal sensor histidine kinase [Massilia sp. KIM]OON64415.1 two-component sensor histidine kinase [Massilia sp. KIM]